MADPRVFAVDPWLRREGESSAAYSAFRVYLEQGPDRRSQRRVAETVGKAESLIARWSSRDDWQERVAAWDAHLLAVAQAAYETEVASMAKRHAQMAVAIQNQIAQRLQGFDATTLTPTQLIQWFDTAVRVERQAKGMPDLTLENVVVTDAEMEGIDTAKLIDLDAWLRAKGGDEEE